MHLAPLADIRNCYSDLWSFKLEVLFLFMQFYNVFKVLV